MPSGQYQKAVRLTRWKRLWGLLGWKTVTEYRVQRGLERLRRNYSKQNYLLSRVNLKEMTYSGVDRTMTPTVEVQLGPKVEVLTSGAKVSRGRLRELVPVYQEQAADRDLLVEGMNNLIEYFQSRGYFRTRVTFETRQEPNGRQNVVYHIDRGERYKLVLLDIEGNRYFSDETILERMSVIPASLLRYRNGRFSESLIESDMESIRSLYRANGFRDAAIDWRVEENYKGKAKDLAVFVSVEEGRQWTVAKLAMEGVSEEHKASVEPLVSSLEGQPFSYANLATDRDNILNYYYNRGYPDAAFEWTVTPSPGAAQMEIVLSLNEGEQQFVRGLLIGGLRTSDPEMVMERMRLSSGEPLSQAMMIESQRRLYDLGVFARVDMAVQNPDGNEQAKYLLYQFEEARKISLNLGFGAEIARIGGGDVNFDAPAGKPGFSPRVSIGISRSNLFGAAHTGSIQTRFSNIQQRGLLTYLAPQFKGYENLSLTVSALFDRSKDIRTFQLRRQEGSMQLSRRLSRANTVQGRFAYRRNTISNLAIQEESIPIFARAVRVGIASATFIQDRRDDPIDSRRGVYNSVDIGLASKAFYSETDYLRLLARNSSYHSFGRGELVLARTSTIGWLHNLRSGQDSSGIPLPERFFSGGGSTHRAFPDNQAGPRDVGTGFPLGGSGIVMNTLELRFPVLGDNVGGVLFHDAGNVYSSLNEVSLRWRQRDATDFNYMVHAIGFGVRYRTPVGPVRFDVAFGPNSPRFQYRGDDGAAIGDRINRIQFHFSLGQTF
jgi:outer membrane protein assembly complex protein YaeT